MHSFWQRLNAIFFYTLSVLGFLAFMAAGTTHWHTAEPAVTVSLKKIMLCALATLFAPKAARTRLGEPRLTASPCAPRFQAQDPWRWPRSGYSLAAA